MESWKLSSESCRVHSEFWSVLVDLGLISCTFNSRRPISCSICSSFSPSIGVCSQTIPNKWLCMMWTLGSVAWIVAPSSASCPHMGWIHLSVCHSREGLQGWLRANGMLSYIQNARLWKPNAPASGSFWSQVWKCTLSDKPCWFSSGKAFKWRNVLQPGHQHRSTLSRSQQARKLCQGIIAGFVVCLKSPLYVTICCLLFSSSTSSMSSSPRKLARCFCLGL